MMVTAGCDGRGLLVELCQGDLSAAMRLLKYRQNEDDTGLSQSRQM